MHLPGVNPLSCGAKCGGVLYEEHVSKSGKPKSIATRSNSEVFIGKFGRSGADWIDDDHPATTLAQGPQPPGKVCSGHHGSVGHQRIGANHQKVVGAIDIWDCD